MGLNQPLMAALVPDDSQLHFELPKIFFINQSKSFFKSQPCLVRRRDQVQGGHAGP